jgi:hypothetical protein
MTEFFSLLLYNSDSLSTLICWMEMRYGNTPHGHANNHNKNLRRSQSFDDELADTELLINNYTISGASSTRRISLCSYFWYQTP